MTRSETETVVREYLRDYLRLVVREERGYPSGRWVSVEAVLLDPHDPLGREVISSDSFSLPD